MISDEIDKLTKSVGIMVGGIGRFILCLTVYCEFVQK